MKAALFPLLAFPLLAGATTIVDTGHSADEFGVVLAKYQFLAAEVSFSGDTDITAIRGWINPDNVGSATVSLYSDGGVVPGTFLHSATFSVPSFDSAWYGAGSLAWSVPAGTYWVVFSVTGISNAFSGSMPRNAPAPLGNEAVWQPEVGNWFASNLNIGVQIDGTMAAAPVPDSGGTIAMLAFGLTAVSIGRRFAIRTGCPQ